jgi:hypothetical protein
MKRELYPLEIRHCKHCGKPFEVPIISLRKFCVGGNCRHKHHAAKDREKGRALFLEERAKALQAEIAASAIEKKYEDFVLKKQESEQAKLDAEIAELNRLLAGGDTPRD